MIKNRVFALSFRIVAFIVCLFGILASLGIFQGQFNETYLLYYTYQSNILVLGFFAVLIYKTTVDLQKKGRIGDNGYFPRISAGILLAIMLTMIVYWLLLAPAAVSSYGWENTFSFNNLCVHLITPLLVLFDYILFSKKGKLKKNDPLLFCIVPIVYFIQAMILGFSGVIYDITEAGEIIHFPYFFMDYYELGLWIIPYILGISLFYLGLGKILLYIDHKRKSESGRESTIN
jgi:hypothetical protein